MQIDLKLNKDFEKALQTLVDEYGEDFEILNGIHTSQTNFSDFIDAFIDKNLNDATIDANANASHKDIASLLAEKGKSIDKVISLNKIFYELKKKYGLATAKEWLKTEYLGGFYLHDAPSATFKPYCYKGENLLTIKYKGITQEVSFTKLYSLLDEEELYDSSIDQVAKFPKDLFVLDLVGNKLIYTKVTRVLKHANYKDMRFIKYSNGLSQIVTADHPIITKTGDIPAEDLKPGTEVLSVDTSSMFTNSVSTITTERQNRANYGTFTLDKDAGWILGFILAEASIGKYQIIVSQSDNAYRANFLKLLDNKNISYNLLNDKITLHSNNPFIHWIMDTFYGQTSEKKQLPESYIHYSFDFLDGIVAGFIDGDGTLTGKYKRTCQIRITSEVLLRQLSNYLQARGIFVGDRTPYLTKSSKSFQSRYAIYGISFNLNDEYFRTLPSIKIDVGYKERLRSGNFAEKKYTKSYGYTKVLINKLFNLELCEEVYDITTDTGHFICNNILSHNCFAYDLSRLAKEGLFFLPNYNAEAPKHLTTFLDDAIEYISFMSNRSSGAVGIPNILVWTMYFYEKDIANGYYIKDKDYYLKQNFQKFIYRLNQPFMRIDQSAFVNVSIFDREYYMSLFGDLVFPDGSMAIDYLDDFIEHEKVFMEVVSEVRSHNMFTFPVLTYSLLYQNNKFVDEEFARWCSDHNCKWNDSNFFVGKDVTTLSNCCRLLSDTTKLKGFFNSIGGTELRIGSVKVNTINLVHMFYELPEVSEAKYLSLLKKRTTLCCKVLDRVRSIIKRNIEKGLLPNYCDGGMGLEQQYCTIGILGLYEVVDKFGYITTDEFGNKSYTEKGLEFADKIFKVINTIKDSFTEDYTFNIESVPAERAAVNLCAKDSTLFDVHDYSIYSNQWIPLTQKCSIVEKIKLSSILDEKCSGGAIMHLNIDSNFPNTDMAWEMLNTIASRGVFYFAFNTKINCCENGHGFVGTDICPECGKPVYDTWQRIVGFLTPSKAYSSARFKEFTAREWYDTALIHGATSVIKD